MNIKEKMARHEQRLKELEQTKEKKQRLKLKIPGTFLRKAKKDNCFVAVILGADMKIKFANAQYREGLIYINDVSYGYDAATVYQHKKVPVVVVYEWRLTPLGGATEEYASKILSAEQDAEVADDLGLKNYGQQTIIRAIKQSEVGMDKKKFGGISPIIWLFIIVGVIYAIQSFFSGG